MSYNENVICTCSKVLDHLTQVSHLNGLAELWPFIKNVFLFVLPAT
jgi:hypothetical protein